MNPFIEAALKLIGTVAGKSGATPPPFGAADPVLTGIWHVLTDDALRALFLKLIAKGGDPAWVADSLQIIKLIVGDVVPGAAHTPAS